MCERYRKSRKSDVNPMSTRANKCGAYVTFAFQQSSLLKICVIRKQLRHSGHDPQNDEERRMSRTDPLVVALIEELSAQGKNTYEIINCIQKRNDESKKTDMLDSISIDTILKTDLNEHVLYYQPLSRALGQPLLIVLQTEQQRSNLFQYGKNVVFMDASYSVDKSQDEDAIICKYLIALDEAREGKFWTLKENKQPYQYMCERYRKSRKSDVNPMSTRANKCGVYVTFAFQQSSLLKICVIRKQLRHSGHDPQNDEERRMSRTDPLVVALIEELSAQGKNTNEIINFIKKRNDESKKTDMRDRAFFPTPAEIRRIAYSFKISNHCHSVDSINIDTILKTDLNEHVLYYQPLSRALGQPLLIVLQTEQQRSLTAYTFAVYILLVRDGFGHGTPIGYIICSSETDDSLRKCLRKFKGGCRDFCPRYVKIYEEDFKTASETVGDFISEDQVKTYLFQNWIPCGIYWSNFGRQFYHENSETNNLAERYFLRLKYQFLKGLGNRRLDDLLMMLTGAIPRYFSYIEGLQSAKRLPNPTKEASEKNIGAAQNLIAQGFETKVVFESGFIYVNCHQNMWILGCMCKHIHLGLLLYRKQHWSPINVRRDEIGKELFEENSFITDESNGLFSVMSEKHNIDIIISFENEKCSCIALSFGFECVCYHVLKHFNASRTTSTEENERSNSPDFKFSSGIESDINKVIRRIDSNFTVLTQERKIKRLQNYRARIEKAKRRVLEHSYNKTTSKTKLRRPEKRVDSTFEIKKSITVVGKSSRGKPMRVTYFSSDKRK
ncbi:unnamed protein product [Mytilus coruscus]|uniref:SWIM-type domain-containing protein n=1 Tax=Mytilus coruscus TaxID=42192 RepID=A0A6J8AHZ5_MYTCO|nr:unnamed protein product [Mytilus coruscus]